MKIYITVLAVLIALTSHSQTPKNIEVNVSEKGSSEKAELSLFHLNHVLYIKSFVISDIYSSVSPGEMAFINNTLIKNISQGRRTQFIIQTAQQIPYRLAVMVVENKGTKMLVILTNFNAKTGKFEKKMEDYLYASSADILDNVILGNMFELPIENEKKYLAEKDYLSLINVNIFNKMADATQMDKWFSLAEETQADKVNNLNWLKSYYHLTQNNFKESQKYLEELKKSVANSPEGEQNQWSMFIQVLSAEISILKEINDQR